MSSQRQPLSCGAVAQHTKTCGPLVVQPVCCCIAGPLNWTIIPKYTELHGAASAQDRRGSRGQLLVTLRVNNDLFCDMAALVALDDTSLRERQNETAPADSLAGAVAAAADSAAAAGRQVLRHALRQTADSLSPMDRAAQFALELGFPNGKVPAPEWWEANDPSVLEGEIKQKQMREREAAQKQRPSHQQHQHEQSNEQQSDEQQQQQAQQQEAALQADDAGLPLLSGAAEDAAAAEADRKQTGHTADALPAQPAAPRLDREFLRFRNVPGLI